MIKLNYILVLLVLFISGAAHAAFPNRLPLFTDSSAVLGNDNTLANYYNQLNTYIQQNVAPITLVGPQNTVTNRAPTLTDNAAAGYANGQFWKQSTGQVWQKTDESSGAAAWTLVNGPSAYPCDAAGGCYTAYGVRRMVSPASYTGNAFQVTRASDSSTQDATFVNDVANIAAIATFCKNTTCTVSKIYNQASTGSTHDCVPASSALNLPFSAQDMNGLTPIVFDALNQLLLAPSSIGNSCVDSAFSVNTATAGVSMFFIGAPDNSYRTGYAAYSTTGWLALNNMEPTINTVVNLSKIGSMSASPQIFGFNCATGGTSCQAIYDDTSMAAGTQINSVTLGAMSYGARTGTAGAGLSARLWGWATFANQLNATNLANFEASVYGNFPLYPQIRTNYNFIGTSLYAGEGAAFNGTPAAQFNRTFLKPVRVSNLAYPGQTCGQLAALTNVIPNATSQGITNVTINECGSNNFWVAGQTVAQAYAEYQNLLAVERATNPTGPIIVSTMQPRSSGNCTNGGTSVSCESLRIAFNSMIRAGIATANGGSALGSSTIGTDPIYLADIGANPLIGANGQQSNTAYYNSDQTHDTFLGYQIYANVEAAAVYYFNLVF